MNEDYVQLIPKKSLDVFKLIIMTFVLLLIHNVLKFTAAISVPTDMSSSYYNIDQLF
jgi:hypothetical protein